MSPLDIGSAVDRCIRLLQGTPILYKTLTKPEFVSGKLDKIQELSELLGNPSPPLRLVFHQLYSFLLEDEEIRRIIRKDCNRAEQDNDFFPFFLFFCSVVVYVEHIKLGKKRGDEE